MMMKSCWFYSFVVFCLSLLGGQGALAAYLRVDKDETSSTDAYVSLLAATRDQDDGLGKWHYKWHHHGHNDKVLVSPECSAAVLTGGGVLGAGAAALLLPEILTLLGFTPAGVEAESFASWWQSTMPLVTKGELFAQLQSIAMTGAGGPAVWMTGSLFGGSVGAKYMTKMCTKIDEAVHNKTRLGKILSGNLKAVMVAIKAEKGTKHAFHKLRKSVHKAERRAKHAFKKFAKHMKRPFVWFFQGLDSMMFSLPGTIAAE